MHLPQFTDSTPPTYEYRASISHMVPVNTKVPGKTTYQALRITKHQLLGILFVLSGTCILLYCTIDTARTRRREKHLQHASSSRKAQDPLVNPPHDPQAAQAVSTLSKGTVLHVLQYINGIRYLYQHKKSIDHAALEATFSSFTEQALQEMRASAVASDVALADEIEQAHRALLDSVPPDTTVSFEMGDNWARMLEAMMKCIETCEKVIPRLGTQIVATPTSSIEDAILNILRCANALREYHERKEIVLETLQHVHTSIMNVLDDEHSLLRASKDHVDELFQILLLSVPVNADSLEVSREISDPSSNLSSHFDSYYETLMQFSTRIHHEANPLIDAGNCPIPKINDSLHVSLNEQRVLSLFCLFNALRYALDHKLILTLYSKSLHLQIQTIVDALYNEDTSGITRKCDKELRQLLEALDNVDPSIMSMSRQEYHETIEIPFNSDMHTIQKSLAPLFGYESFPPAIYETKWTHLLKITFIITTLRLSNEVFRCVDSGDVVLSSLVHFFYEIKWHINNLVLNDNEADVVIEIYRKADAFMQKVWVPNEFNTIESSMIDFSKESTNVLYLLGFEANIFRST